MNSALSVLLKLPRSLAGALFLAAMLLIGWLDWLSGPEVSLFIFYAVPIALSGAVLGTRAGVMAAMLSCMTWWVANRSSHLYHTEFAYVLAMLNRLFYFGVVAGLVHTARKKQEADAARIRVVEERRQLEHELLRVSEREQVRIGQDLHDGVCQELAAISCAARMLANDLKEKNLPEFRDAILIESAVQNSALGARNLARGLFPVHMDADGLSAALDNLAKSLGGLTGSKIEVEVCAEEIVLKPEVAMHLYRIAQEALANAVRHSGASKISVMLQVSNGVNLEMRIEDDGKGLGRLDGWNGNGMGIKTMHYRAEAVGGRLEIAPRPGGGTMVSCRMGLPAPGRECKLRELR